VSDNTIYTNATIDPDDGKTPLVYWKYRNSEGVMSLPLARERAVGLFTAAAIAESEAAIAKQIMESGGTKGFGRNPKNDQFVAQVLHLFRQSRPPLNEGIEVIFGLKTATDLINVSWYETQIQMEVDNARFHASVLLQTAEASESDRFFYHFLFGTVGVGIDDANKMVQEFNAFRKITVLEDLMKR
jgi:hypothetical protein